MTANFVDFRTVKERVSIEQVLEHYNVRLRRASQTALRGFCPLPTHSSDKSRESFGVDIAKKIWSCQSASCASARNGKKGGNILDFVALMESCSVREAALKLNDWFLHSNETRTSSTVQKPERVDKNEKTKLVAEKTDELAAGNRPLSFALTGVDTEHEYIRTRGITKEIAERFNVGFFPGRGSMRGRVVIPISNERGELVAYAGRAIDDTEPKYKLPTGFKKSEVLFNLHRVRQDQNARSVIVVEGFFDTMKIVQAGFSNVVALMGTALSQAQENLLESFREIVLMLDGDPAGESAAAGLVSRLARSHFVRIVSVAGQPDQLTSEEIRTILSKLV